MSKAPLVPAYVQSALTADRTQQLNTLSTLVVYLFNEQKAGRDTPNLGATLHKAAPHRSEKTWQNYASGAAAVVAAQSVKLESLHAEHQGPVEMVGPFTHWFTDQLRVKKYATSIEDVTNWAKNKPSMALQKKAKDKADADALREQAKADALLPPAPTQAEKDVQEATRKAAEDAAAARAAAAAEPAAAARAEEGAERSAVREAIAALTGHAPAIQAPSADTAGGFVLSVARKQDGTLQMTFDDADTVSDDELMTLALTFESMLEERVKAKAADPALM